ncbi:structure-specific endonuclease subunit SLX1 homolog [Epargyreus clarus]|uniref:structure-specific endonuclease subunit SLX1 homolog n=1 Tax=Epargyreus clarus TaxID=520877 RepID=UPI003C2EFAFE
MAEPELIVDFFGVYLLYNINPKFKGRTYIGYTRDPNRRLMQHNRGTWAGGAYRTSNRGPWKMVMIIHGFPNNISALRFEWAWQNPNKTIRLQHLNLKKVPRKESDFQFKLRVLSEMLKVGPWCRLPLTIRWLENEYFEEFQPERKPPDHMKVCHGPVKSRNLKPSKDTASSPIRAKCGLCFTYSNAKEQLTCMNSNCDLVVHITCLADKFLPPGEYIPIEGYCPKCKMKLKWGDLIRKMKGCYETTTRTSEELEEQNSDDDIVCTQDRQFVDNHSWFLDCNEDL